MSTIITPSEDQINIVITDDAVNVNIVSEPVVVNVTEQIVEISTASGAYPLPTTVYSVFGRTGAIIAQEGDYDLGELGDVTLVSKVNGDVLTYDGTKWINKAVSGTGTVTSVDMSVPTGLQVSGNPVIAAGTLAVSFADGYSIPTNAKQSNWDAAYNDKINSADVSGTTTKTLTLTQQDGGTITASWTDINTNLVTSVNTYIGDVVLTTTDIAEGLKLYYTEQRVSANVDVAANTAARHSAVTIGTANGLSLSSQVLSLALASASITGALSSTDWSTFNNKQNQLNGTGFVKASGTSISYDNSTYLTSADVSGYVPYTGATSDVNLGSNDITASAIIKSGGVDTQFLKADGSVDNNNYLTADDLPSTLSLYATTTPSAVSGYTKLVTTIEDPDYNTTAVDVSTGEITIIDQFISALVSPANLINGNPGVFNVSTYGNIKKVSGSGQAEFYFKIYKRDSAGVETLVGTSSNTLPVVNSGYSEFFATAIWNDGIFGVTDTIVLKYYGSRIAGGSNPTYNFQFGGVTPVRTIVPIPTAVIPNIYLGELADVEDGTASNNDGIYYDSTVSLWKYKSIAEVLTYTPANDASVVHLAGAETITGQKNFSGIVHIDTNHFNFKFQSGLGVTSGYMGFAPIQSSTLNLLNYTDGNNATTLQLIYDNTIGRQYHFPDATSGQLALTSQLSSFISLTSLSATAPLAYNNTTGGFSISQAGVSGNGYLSSTDWNTFNNKQTAGDYITALTGEATASGPGSASVTLSTSAVTGKILTGINITGGSITATDSILVALGKAQNQINGLLGGAIYQSTWNASTNTPTLASGTGTKGYYYIVSVAGSTNLDGITDWKVGDWAIFNGTTWDKVDNTDAVSSVNGFTGAVSLTTANISEVTNLYYTEARVSANTNVAANTAARHAAVTLGTANGLSLSTQQLSLGLASTTATGALSSTDWNTFNAKQPALSGTGFVKISGSTISYDNSTYLTTSAASSTYLPLAGGTLTGALGGTSASFSGSSTASNFILSGGTGNTGLYYGHTDRVVLANYTAGGIDFEVNGGTTSMTLFPSGNLGIGASLTDAGYKLDVNGTARVSGNLYGSSQIAIGGQAIIYGGLSGLYALQNGNSSYYSYDQESGIVGNGYYDSGWKYKTTNLASRYIANIGTHKFQYAVSGTAGAGLTWVDALSIASTGAATFSSSVQGGMLRAISGTGGIATGVGVEIGYESGGFGTIIAYDRGGGTGFKQLRLNDSMYINGGGNVGIGTSNPRGKLDVDNIYIGTASSTHGFIRSADGITIDTDYDNSGSDGYFAITNSGVTRFHITDGGDVGIGGSIINQKLYVKASTSNGTTNAFLIHDSTSADLFFIRTDGLILTGSSSASPYNLATTGRSAVIESNGVLGYTSSTRESKTNIEQLSDVSWLYQLNPVSFNYRKKDDEMNYTDEAQDDKWYGLIADEVESVNQDLVFYNTKEDGTKQLAGVEYNKIIAALIKSSQELSAQIEELKALINK